MGKKKGKPSHSYASQKGEGTERTGSQTAQQQQKSSGPEQQDPQAGGDWQRGPPQSLPQQQQQQQQQQVPQAGGDWQRGPPQSLPQQQQQQQQQQVPQAGGAWQRGPPQSLPQQQQQQQQQQVPQAGAAWQRGPPQSLPQQQPQQVSPAGRGWQRGPPQSLPQQQQQQQQQQVPQAGAAWQRGPPQSLPQQQQQQVSPAGRGWQRGPPQSLPQQQQQQVPQAGGAWQRGPPQSLPQQQQQVPQSGSGWQKRPLQSPSHHQSPPGGGTREREHGDSPQKQRQRQESPESSKDRRQKSEKSERKQESSVVERTLEFAPRIPAPKKSGRQLTVLANFFRLSILNPDITVYHYDVVIEPDKPKFLLRDVWNKYVSLVYPGRLTAFEGKNAYSKGPLSDSTAVTTVTVKNPEREGVEKQFQVSIKLAQVVNWSCFDNYRERMLQSRSMKVLPEREIAILDIILRNSACDSLVRCGKSFFPLSSKLRSHSDLSPKLSLRMGYFQSAFLGYMPFLNFDVSHKAFYKDCRVTDIVESFRNRYNNSIDVDDMSRFLRTVKVEYELPNDKGSRRIFRVNKLVGSAREQTFKKDDGSQMSVAEYFAAEKKCPIRYPELPALWVGPTQKSIYVPMEFCKIVPDQVYRGLVDAREQREMVRGATSDARRRRDDIYKLFDKNAIKDDPLLKEFGLKVATDMEEVPARVLDPPVLRTSKSVRVRDGVFNIQDFLEPVTLDKWCILILDKRVRRESVIKLQELLKSRGNAFNMRISNAARDPIEGEPSFPGLKKAFSQMRGMKMVFVIIPDSKGVYSKVKAICETQEGILTQCIKGGTVGQDERKLFTTVQNILLKVNAKLGGKNHCLDKSSAPPCLKGKVMVVGADVTHPSPGLKIPSVAAVTVSCDPEAFQYGTTTRVQPKGEMIKDMQDIISIHLKKFYELRKSYPEKIIFFRDGVSEGELEKVYKGELAAVRNACSGLCQPKITFVVVQKRHHTRLFPTSQADETGKNYNVPVGTCVDSVIVHPRDLDFYLVSHASILGTARPTRYRLLHDDNKLNEDEIETLSYYLCHLFSRCTRSVSYPSPTYNAHLAAARIRAQMEGLNLTGDQDIDYIKKQLKDNISNNYPMFFV